MNDAAITLLILIANFSGYVFRRKWFDVAASFKMHSILSYFLDLNLFQNLIFYKHYSSVGGRSLSYNWLHDFKFVLPAPLRPSATLNYQAATRFIEHSLPDLTPGRCSFTNCPVHESFTILSSFHWGVAHFVQARSRVWEILVEERGQRLSI